MQILDVRDERFRQYGRIIGDIASDEVIKAMEASPLPEDVIYVASDEVLEQLPIQKIMSESFYGGMPVQVGYCNGHNNRLNALEYHRSSEINIAVTDMILLLGRQQDIGADYTYDTGQVEAFRVLAGMVVEMYATTLHYAPCGIDGEGFKCVVVLPKGTNYPLDCEVKHQDEYGANISENRLLAARNKWLIAHREASIDGAYVGLTGDNITL